MKLTAELINSAPCYLNALSDRELDLRSHKIPAIENLGVTKDLNDSIDLTDNDIRALTNFPSLPRLKCLLLSNNRISKIDNNLAKYVPNITTLVLTNNALQELADIEGLAGLQRLEYLSLLDNPLTKKKYYRLWVIWKIKSLRVLDFQKVKLSERQEGKKLFETKSGPSALAESITAQKSSTFEPGEGVPQPLKTSVPTLTLTKEEQDTIREALAKATTLDEITRLEAALKEGKMPSHLIKDKEPKNPAKRQKTSNDQEEEEEEEEEEEQKQEEEKKE
ncbi:U2 small nuclear ribonucleoprotein A' [Actinomortierella wolfii]|nr:U2 small nuclear ribonucleoprotein A' [Actinomortierella wolfii]KAG0236014.1 U2 small nuclear ribonucleoprotein A' [Actinomortierella wolfii]